MSEKEQLEKQYAEDLHDLVDTYRAFKRGGKWVAGIFAFILVIVSIILAIKQIFTK